MGARIQRRTVAPAARPKSAISRGSTWTDERVEQLKVGVRAGLSCSQIAGQIGVSRNAVIGKMNRLGLSRPKSVLAREPETKGTAWRPGSAVRSGGNNITRIFGQHRILMQLPPAPEGAEVVSIHDGHGCSLLELGPGKCRWPISEPDARDFCFCGSNQVEGLPYCVGHARMAYKSVARNGARV